MLLTRCPECDTTYRVTDETLKMASGQVRCGRCASVFNAYAELHDAGGKRVEHRPRGTAETEVPAAKEAPPPAASPGAASLETPGEAERNIAAASVAEVVAEARVAADDAAAEAAPPNHAPPDALAISAKEVDRVLTVDSRVPPSAYLWPETGASERRPQTRWWTAAAALALLVLAAQGVHHFRATIAEHPSFGPWLAAAYEALGSEIPPSWDVHQYQIIDWVATAEPNARGLGSLKITARIQNRGPSRQPYPAVQLRLKDRWEAALGSRMFTPAEYLPRDTPRGRLMSPGETTRAEIEVVDPGPDAYGFELDVCIEVEASLVTCGADEVFL
jgi:predicted Zn finger-like uncharacterized protein